MSRLLARLRLQFQIGLIGLVGLIGLGGFGAFYYAGNLVQTGLQRTADRTASYHEAITGIDRAIAEAGRAEMAFLLWHKEDYVAQHDKFSQSVSSGLEQMENELRKDGAGELADKVAKIRVGFAGYVSQFITVTQLSKSVGLDEDSGLLGRLRKAVHEAEEVMKEVDEPRLLQWMLMMRRNEKDFLARHGEKYLAEMKQSKAKFDEVLAASGLPEEQRGKIADKIKDYQRDFAIMSDGVLELDGETEKLAKKRLAIEPIVADVTSAIAQMYHDTSAEMDESREGTSRRLIIVFALVAVLLMLSSGAIGYSIARPVTRMVAVMERLAQGERQIEIDYADRRDEVGAMARSVQVFKENGEKIDQLRAEQEAAERQAEIEKKRTLDSIAATFEANVQKIVGAVSAAADELETTARSLSDTASRTQQRAMGVASSSRQTSMNVQTVATAADELSASIGEIGRQVEQASRVAGQAADDSQRTNASVEGLAEAAQKIGEVVALINDIAGQTNLLALNATIEAARAGEAGKGFAVVASEVKSLANQTSKATDDIRSQIGAIQSATESAVAAIRAISTTIVEVSSISSSIAAAVEEQSSATQEIARNVQQVAAGTEEVSKTIGGVTETAGETGTAAEEVLVAAGRLSEQSAQLRQQVDRFLAEIRAA